MERELYKEVYREQAEELCAFEAAQTDAMVEGWQAYGQVSGEGNFRCMIVDGLFLC